MNQLLTFSLLLFALTTFGQQMTSTEWNEQAKTNMRLLPKYGYRQKTDEQKNMDEKFINETMQQDKFKNDRRAASNHLIELGLHIYIVATLKLQCIASINPTFLTQQTRIFIGVTVQCI